MKLMTLLLLIDDPDCMQIHGLYELFTYIQARSAEEAGAVAESVRKKLKTGREKLDRAEHQLSVDEESGTTATAKSDDRLYAKHVSYAEM